MIGSVGLAASYPGYLQGEKQGLENDTAALVLHAGQIDQAGQDAFGKWIQSLQQQMPGATPMPPQGSAPQSPMPGQPSQPMQPPPQAQGGPQPAMLSAPPQAADPTWSVGAPQAGGGSPAGPASFNDRFGGGAQPAAKPPAPQAPAADAGTPPAPTGGQPQGRLDLQTVMRGIAQANPGAKPAVIAAAVNKALPLMTAQAQMDWRLTAMALGAGRLQESQTHHRAQEGTAAVNADTRKTATENTADYRERRLDQIDASAAYRQVRDQLNRDQRYQALEQQKQRIEQSGQRIDLAAARGIIDAQHKRAMEIIQTSSAFTQMNPEDKKTLLAEQDKAYKEQIMQLRARNQGGAAKPSGAAPGEVPAQAPQRQQFRNKSTGAMEDFELRDGKWVPVK